jgi:hypothetical protein
LHGHFWKLPLYYGDFNSGFSPKKGRLNPKPYNPGKGLGPRLWFWIWVGAFYFGVLLSWLLEVGWSSLLFMFLPFPFGLMFLKKILIKVLQNTLAISTQCTIE